MNDYIMRLEFEPPPRVIVSAESLEEAIKEAEAKFEKGQFYIRWEEV